MVSEHERPRILTRSFPYVVLAVTSLASTCCACKTRKARPPTSTNSSARPAPLTLDAVECAFGSHGVVSAAGALAAPRPAYAIAFVDARARKDIHGFKLASFHLEDDKGNRIAGTKRVVGVRVAPVTRSTRDYSSWGTKPFGGVIRKGKRVRLWIQVELDRPLKPLMNARPARFKARFTAKDGVRSQVEGKVSPPWPAS